MDADRSRAALWRYAAAHALTNGLSKKLENHEHMLAIYFMYYNFRRAHQTLRVTPAMEAGLTDHIWGVDELVKVDGAEVDY